MAMERYAFFKLLSHIDPRIPSERHLSMRIVLCLADLSAKSTALSSRTGLKLTHSNLSSLFVCGIDSASEVLIMMELGPLKSAWPFKPVASWVGWRLNFFASAVPHSQCGLILVCSVACFINIDACSRADFAELSSHSTLHGSKIFRRQVLLTTAVLEALGTIFIALKSLFILDFSKSESKKANCMPTSENSLFSKLAINISPFCPSNRI